MQSVQKLISNLWNVYYAREMYLKLLGPRNSCKYIFCACLSQSFYLLLSVLYRNIKERERTFIPSWDNFSRYRREVPSSRSPEIIEAYGDTQRISRLGGV